MRGVCGLRGAYGVCGVCGVRGVYGVRGECGCGGVGGERFKQSLPGRPFLSRKYPLGAHDAGFWGPG